MSTLDLVKHSKMNCTQNIIYDILSAIHDHLSLDIGFQRQRFLAVIYPVQLAVKVERMKVACIELFYLQESVGKCCMTHLPIPRQM